MRPTHLTRASCALVAAAVCALPFATSAPARDALKGHPAAHEPLASTIVIAKFAFAPKEITITPGTTLVWANQDQTPHDVQARDKSFSSGGMDTGDSYRHTFTQAGDFSYFCTMHPFMTGIVHVRK